MGDRRAPDGKVGEHAPQPGSLVHQDQRNADRTRRARRIAGAHRPDLPDRAQPQQRRPAGDHRRHHRRRHDDGDPDRRHRFVRGLGRRRCGRGRDATDAIWTRRVARRSHRARGRRRCHRALERILDRALPHPALHHHARHADDRARRRLVAVRRQLRSGRRSLLCRARQRLYSAGAHIDSARDRRGDRRCQIDQEFSRS